METGKSFFNCCLSVPHRTREERWVTRFGLIRGFLRFSLSLQEEAGERIQGFLLCTIVQSLEEWNLGSPARLQF